MPNYNSANRRIESAFQNDFSAVNIKSNIFNIDSHLNLPSNFALNFQRGSEIKESINEYKNISVIEEEEEGFKEVGILHIGEVFEEIKFGFEKEVKIPLVTSLSETIYSCCIILSIIITCIDPVLH